MSWILSISKLLSHCRELISSIFVSMVPLCTDELVPLFDKHCWRLFRSPESENNELSGLSRQIFLQQTITMSHFPRVSPRSLCRGTCGGKIHKYFEIGVHYSWENRSTLFEISTCAVIFSQIRKMSMDILIIEHAHLTHNNTVLHFDTLKDIQLWKTL